MPDPRPRLRRATAWRSTRARGARPEPHAARRGFALAVLVAAALLQAGVAVAAAPQLEATGPLRLEGGPDGRFLLGDGRRFVDTLELVPDDEGPMLINELGMEAYVAGVAEMPSRWPLEALKAQAVAARTYGWYSIQRDSFDGYHVCGTVACQVFRGADTWLDSDTGERWLEAVRATEGEVLLDDGAPILARYFSTSGGRTYANEDVFPDSGARPYLVAVEDPYDVVSPYHRWTARFTRDEFDEILSRGDTLAAAVPVAAVERLGDVDDPAAAVRVTGRDGTQVDVASRDLREFLSRVAPSRFPDRFPGRRADGLRPLPTTVPSSRFDIEVTDDEVVLHGRGWGHGVGLGQYGALGRAREGHDYGEILAAYYNGLTPTVPDALPDRIRVGLGPVDAEVAVTGEGAGAFRVVAGDTVLVERALGTWTVTRDGDGWVLTPPAGHDDALEVADTRVATDLDVGDAVVVETDVNKPVMLRLEVRDPAGDTVVVRELGTGDAGRHTATWRFDDVDGHPVPAGDYTVALLAEDAAGTVAGAPVTVPVDAAGARTGDAGGSPVGAAGRPWMVVGAAVVLPLALILAVIALRRTP